MRLAHILSQCECKSVKIEKRMPYYLPLRDGKILKIRYRLDVYARKGKRRIGVEVDGFMGHKSERAIRMDKLRTIRLREAYRLERIYRFTFKQLANWTDKEIAAEMKL